MPIALLRDELLALSPRVMVPAKLQIVIYEVNLPPCEALKVKEPGRLAMARRHLSQPPFMNGAVVAQ